MMKKKRNESYSVEKELSLVDIDDLESISPNATEEMQRMYTLWDAVRQLR